MNQKKENFSHIEIIKKIWKYYHPYKIRIIIALFLCFLSCIACVASIYFMSLLYQKYFLSTSDLINYFTAFVALCVITLILKIIKSLFVLFQDLLIISFSEKITYQIRKHLLEKIHKLPISFFDQTPSGKLMSRLVVDVDNISNFVSQYFGNMLSYILDIIACVVMMFLINWILAIFVISIFPIIGITNWIIFKKIPFFNIKMQNQITKFSSFCEENISGLKVITAFNMSNDITKKFDVINDNVCKYALASQTLTSISLPINRFLSLFSFFIILIVGGPMIVNYQWFINLHAPFIDKFDSYALLLLFINFAWIACFDFYDLISGISLYFLAIISAKRIFDILEINEQLDNKNAQDININKGEIIVNNLSFEYEKNKPILKNLSFSIKPGQVVALVGPTGCGKTTFVNLLSKFYSPTSGQIKIDGVDIENITMDSLRKNISVVLQETYLFSQSVYDNIRYGRLDATNQEIIEAAKAVNLHEFIMLLPNKYDTILSDNGNDLSQGQRQLLAIARFYLTKPKIIILDEATSSIDTRTEILINQSLEKLMANKTCFIIAHRLSTIKNVDNIIVLNHGEIVETGSHNELLKKNGFYANLYNSQFRNGELI